jgi:hypothetical protein
MGRILTEAFGVDVQVPQVHAKVVGRQKRFSVAIKTDGVDVVSVSVREHTARSGGQNRLLPRNSRDHQAIVVTISLKDTNLFFVDFPDFYSFI